MEEDRKDGVKKTDSGTHFKDDRQSTVQIGWSTYKQKAQHMALKGSMKR